MWNPVKDYPLSSFVDGIGTLFGSLVLFFTAGVLAFLMVAADAHFSPWELLFGWPLCLVMSCVGLFGIPFLAIHFWTLYKLLYTEDSRLKLFYIAVAAHSVDFILLSCFTGDFSDYWIRDAIVIAVLTACFIVMYRLHFFKYELAD